MQPRKPIAAPAGPLAADLPKLRPFEFEEIREFARLRFGLDLRPGKEDLVSARLAGGMRRGRFASFRDYLAHVRSDETGDALVALIDALTTHHTSFYREPLHFEYLEKSVLPGFGPGSDLRIWSAACSTGEEPYSIACAVAQAWNGQTRGLRILATDVSSKVLATAKAASYAEAALAAAPMAWRMKYFIPSGTRDGAFRLRPEVARAVTFRRLNLVENAPMPERFQIIFCRNVMIYFDKPAQERLVCRLAEFLEPEGYLFVGHSESLVGVRHPLAYVRPAIYRKTARRRAA